MKLWGYMIVLRQYVWDSRVFDAAENLVREKEV